MATPTRGTPRREDERLNEIMRLMQSLTPQKRQEAMTKLQAGDRARSVSIDIDGDEEVTEEVASGSTHVVVETTANSHRRLPQFSGRKGGKEVDFATWKLSALQILQDSSIRDVNKRRMILFSLSRPALDVVRELTEASSREVFDVLDAAFGICVDGQELFAQFLGMYQQDSEDASEYLQRLYIHLIEVIEHEGMDRDVLENTLLKQFIRGCQEEELLTRLRLEDRDPVPQFPELLLIIRKEEARRQDRKSRLGKRAKTAAVSEAATSAPATSPSNPLEEQIKALREEVAKLACHMRQPVEQKSQPEAKSKDSQRTEEARQKKEAPKRKNYFFCYRCGQDGHHQNKCDSKSNPTLVQEKLLARTAGTGNGKRQP